MIDGNNMSIDTIEFARKLNHLAVNVRDLANKLARLELGAPGTKTLSIPSHVHPTYLSIGDIDDTPVNGETSAPPSSNWAFDHAASPTDINHLTDAQVTALHAKYTDAEAVDALEAVTGAVLAAADSILFIDATDGVMKKELLSDITEDMLTAIKTYIDNSRMEGGTMWIPGSNFVPTSAGGLLITDGVSAFPSNDANTYVLCHIPSGLDVSILVDGVTKYLTITNFHLHWYQVGAADDVFSLEIRRVTNTAPGTYDVVVNDTTQRGSAGYNNYNYTSFSNNTLTSTKTYFTVILNYLTSGAGSDWRIQGAFVDYTYS